MIEKFLQPIEGWWVDFWRNMLKTWTEFNAVQEAKKAGR